MPGPGDHSIRGVDDLLHFGRVPLVPVRKRAAWADASTSFFDRLALGYDRQELQALAYRPTHDAVLDRLVEVESQQRIAQFGVGGLDGVDHGPTALMAELPPALSAIRIRR